MRLNLDDMFYDEIVCDILSVINVFHSRSVRGFLCIFRCILFVIWQSADCLFTRCPRSVHSFCFFVLLCTDCCGCRVWGTSWGVALTLFVLLAVDPMLWGGALLILFAGHWMASLFLLMVALN